MTELTTEPLDVAPAEDVEQISFDQAMEAEIVAILARYPTRRAALLPLLWLCHDRWGWISRGMISAIASRLELAPAFIEGVLTFYTMYQRQPPGRYLLEPMRRVSLAR